MSATDWLLLSIVAVSSLLGLMRGFIGMAVSLAGWLLSGWVALRYGPEVGPMLAAPAVAGPGYVAAGYGMCFAAVMALTALAGWALRAATRGAGLGGVDRALGFAVGCARGAFAACLIVLLMGLTSLPRQPQWQSSWVVGMFVPGAEWLRDWLPAWAASRVYLGMPARIEPARPA